MTTSFEARAPESVMYKRGTVCVKLEGFNAMLYRTMVWRYGKAKATEDFWWLWHKKSGALSPENAAQSL